METRSTHQPMGVGHSHGSMGSDPQWVILFCTHGYHHNEVLLSSLQMATSMLLLLWTWWWWCQLGQR